MSQAHFVHGPTVRLTNADGKILVASVDRLAGGSYVIFAKAVVATVLGGAFVPCRAIAQFELQFYPSTPATMDVAYCMLDVRDDKAQPINTVPLNLGASFSPMIGSATSVTPASQLRGLARLYCTLFSVFAYNPADDVSRVTIEVSHATLTVLAVDDLKVG
jgi:hypothetical protein